MAGQVLAAMHVIAARDPPNILDSMNFLTQSLQTGWPSVHGTNLRRQAKRVRCRT